MGHIGRLQDIEKRAQSRPCTLDHLAGLDRELKERVVALRREREVRREKDVIEPESPELRKAMQSTRTAIRHAMGEHETARLEISRLQEMVRRGHVHEALKERGKLQTLANFQDVNCDFVEAAMAKLQTREQWLVVIALIVAGITLVVVTVIELMKRSTSNLP